MIAKEVMRALAFRQWNAFKEIIVPNCSGMLGHEADLLILRPSGWMEEAEIKVSKADFRRDFGKKFKHRMLQQGKPKYNWNLPYTQENRGYDWADTAPHLIHRFWYAMPEKLAEELLPEIPDYAGLISVSESQYAGFPKVLKPAPVLPNSRKLTEAEISKLLKYAYFKYWNWVKPLEINDAELSTPLAAQGGLGNEGTETPSNTATTNGGGL